MPSRMTPKGQILIPREIRRELGLLPGMKIGFQKQGGKFWLVKETEEEYLSQWRGKKKLPKGTSVDDWVDGLRGDKLDRGR